MKMKAKKITDLIPIRSSCGGAWLQNKQFRRREKTRETS